MPTRPRPPAAHGQALAATASAVGNRWRITDTTDEGEASMRRRDFLGRTAGFTAATALLPAARASGQSDQEGYDVIVVGAGPAGCIAARRLVDRFPDKAILLVEAGGPTTAEVGGHDFPPYDTQATIFDVPGEYQNIAFQPKGEPYRQKETPSTDVLFYNAGASEIVGDIYAASGFRHVDTSVLGSLGDRYFSRAWLSPWRRYSRSATSISCVVCVPAAMRVSLPWRAEDVVAWSA
jgi:hypothetical protein